MLSGGLLVAPDGISEQRWEMGVPNILDLALTNTLLVYDRLISHTRSLRTKCECQIKTLSNKVERRHQDDAELDDTARPFAPFSI